MAVVDNHVHDSAENISLHLSTSQQLMSDETNAIVIESVFFIEVPIAAFGLLANLANIIVFYRMGFSVVSNISLFALAVSDMISLTYMLLTSFSHHPDFQHVRIFLPFTDVMLAVAPLHYCSSAFGSWVTAIISVERSYCVVFPMKVKTIFTRKTIFWLLVGMLVYQISGVPQYASHTMSSQVSPGTNQTLYFFDQSQYNAELSLVSVFISFSLPTLVCFIVVTIATIFLIIKFKQSLQVRKTMSSQRQKTVSTKDTKMIRSVIFICCIYIFGYLPGVGYFLISTTDTSFHMFDPYIGNVVKTILAVSFATQVFSCSVNIFVYLTMSTKYKETFKALFSC